MSTTIPTLLDTGLRGAAIALALLLAWVLARDRPRLAAIRTGVPLLGCLIAELIVTAPDFTPAIGLVGSLLVGAAVAASVPFWLFVRALFDDDFEPRPHHLGLALGMAALGVCACLLPAPMRGFAGVLIRWLPAGFAGLAAFEAIRRHADDLVERRLRLRPFIVVVGVAYALVQLVARNASSAGALNPAVATADAGALGLIFLIVAVRWLSLGANDLLPAGAAPNALHLDRRALPAAEPGPAAADPAASTTDADEATDPEDEAHRIELLRLLADDGVHRAGSLSVASLAERMGLPEYRLRRLINRRLGYRNFNAFVNAHRIADARAALADPARRATAVLEIALESGFQSIGPFNRAFKAETGMTPSEYRRQRLGAGADAAAGS